MRLSRRWCLPLAILTFDAAMAQAQDPPPTLSIGPNVQVSKAFGGVAHYEGWADSDDGKAGRLVACSMVAHQNPLTHGSHCYASADNGASWSTVLDLDTPRNFDPYVTFGRGDTAFYTTMAVPMEETASSRRSTLVYRSADGGNSWKLAAALPLVDRESIVVDRTGGRFDGRVYVSGQWRVNGVNDETASSIHLFRSLDGGDTFLGPVQRATLDGGSLLGHSKSVVMSDGTLAFLVVHLKKGRTGDYFDEKDADGSANASLQVGTSTDGGETLNPLITVAAMYMDRRTSEGAVMPQLAVDAGSRFFKDRLYAVWPDVRGGGAEVLFAYSTDKGKTWSQARRVNDDRPPAEGARAPVHMLPTVTVNDAGAVLVVWYDRRDSKDNLSWKIRAAASLDGGVTFGPSVLVSDAVSDFTSRTEWIISEPGVPPLFAGIRRIGGGDAPITVDVALHFFLTNGGHTSGLAVGRDGIFHPVWVDNRTGVAQLWTAPVTVRGSVERYGARELADLDDVTDRVAVEVPAGKYDRATNTLILTTRLKNNSDVPLRGPLKVRVVRLESQLGVPAVAGAENGLDGVGAILDFASMLPAGGLAPGATAAGRTVKIRLSDVRPIQLSRDAKWSYNFKPGLVDFDVRVFAGR